MLLVDQMANSSDEDIFQHMEFEQELPTKRLMCSRCKRPITVCWCPFLPEIPISIKTQVIVLQHGREERRCLSTTPMLTLGLQQENFKIIKGARFNLRKNPFLAEVVADENTYLLFPDKDAIPIENIPHSDTCNLIVLDGTWEQAKGIYWKNEFIQNLKKVTVSSKGLSKYVVRTQPTDACVSTVESVALALEALENDSEIYQKLTRPLEALCEFQIENGAVAHQSKEYLIKNGLYKSQKSEAKHRIDS